MYQSAYSLVLRLGELKVFQQVELNKLDHFHYSTLENIIFKESQLKARLTEQEHQDQQPHSLAQELTLDRCGDNEYELSCSYSSCYKLCKTNEAY